MNVIKIKIKNILKRCSFVLFDLMYQLKMKRVIYSAAIYDCRYTNSAFHLIIHEFLVSKGENRLANSLSNTCILSKIKAPLVSKTSKLARSRKFSEQQFAETLNNVFTVLTSAGLNPFLTFGSLLGYVREGKLIEWDTDLDIGLFYDETDVSILENCMKNLGFTATKDLNTERCFQKIYTKSGSPLLDIVLFIKDQNNVLTHIKIGKEIIQRRRTLFKLTEVKYYETIVKIPENPEIFLTENYGDWQTPKVYHHPLLDSKLTDYGKLVVKHAARRHMMIALRHKDERAVKHYAMLFAQKMDNEIWNTANILINEKSNLH